MSVRQTLLDSVAPPFIRRQADEIDRRLPEWARRSNPIVRRQLGVFWKLMTVDVDLIARLYLFNAMLVGLSLLVPFLFMLLMPAATLSVVGIPALMVMYTLSLARIGASAAASLADERHDGSLDLLRVCPRPLHEILFSKAAAAVWRQIENLGLILSGVAAVSLPLVVIQYDWLFPAQDQPLMMRVAVLLALATSILRIPLEVALVASIGVAVGAFTRYRLAAMVTALMLAAAYFGLLNATRLLPFAPAPRLLIDVLLPLIAPLPLIALAHAVAVRRIERE